MEEKEDIMVKDNNGESGDVNMKDDSKIVKDGRKVMEDDYELVGDTIMVDDRQITRDSKHMCFMMEDNQHF